MDELEWNEQRSGSSRTLSRCGPGGYQASILVDGGTVSGRLWKPLECHDSLSYPPEALAADQVDATVRRIQQEIDSRIEELESGHS